MVGVARERREEKRALVPFVPKRLTRRGGGKGGRGLAQARHAEESGEGSGTDVAHSEGGAQQSRYPGATGTVARGQCGRQRSGAVHVGHACRRGPTGEGRELGQAREQQCRF
jgi:hypothetical protein